MQREIFLLAGEASGDLRGAELIRALRAASDTPLRFSGMGGQAMRREGMETCADLTEKAVVGVIEVLRNYAYFKRHMDELVEEVRRRKPSILVGVDYPGFNLRFLKRVRRELVGKHGYNPQLIQYISPQLWAWKEGRKFQMAAYLDKVLCLFPFEPALYEDTGLKAVFVGHPILDEIAYSEDNRNDALVGVFPGSRERELRAHLPVLRELAARLKKSESCLRLLFAASSAGAKRIISSELPDAEFAEGPWLRQHAACGVVCSGTATLEAAMAGLPMCVIYRVAWPTYLMGRWLIKVPHLAMPNILAGRELVKELIQGALTPHALEEELLRLTGDQSYRRSIQTGYREIRGKMGEVGAATRAAREILEAAKP